MRVHLIGIGGTGMGALAGLLKARGDDVRGSDEALYPPMSDQLAALAIPVSTPYAPENLDWGPERVVVGNVCGKDHIEVRAAEDRALPLYSFPQILSECFLADRTSVVITGTHGKTTTSSLLVEILRAAGRDPSCFIGGVPIGLGQGWRLGAGAEFVVEGDEYDTAFFDKGSKFLHYRPTHAVLTSVELDHVDIFSSIEAVRATFRSFVRLLPEDGLLMVDANSSEACAIADSDAACTVERYAVASDGSAPAGCAWVASEIAYTRHGRCRFRVHHNGDFFEHFESLLIGEHNVGNLLAAIGIAHRLGLRVDQLVAGVSQFAGVRRRQELRGIGQGVSIIDDYGHHPTEIERTLRAMRGRFAGRRLIAIYEPRTATSRRKIFQNEMVDALVHADAIIVAPLFSPTKIPEEERFDAQKLALDLHQRGLPSFFVSETEDIVRRVVDFARPGDVVCVFSTGGFDNLHDRLLAALGDGIRPAKLGEVPAIRSLLQLASVAWEHIDPDSYADFLVLQGEEEIIGCVCMEVHGQEGILRALAVDPRRRGVGYGWLLADTAIGQAHQRGVRRVYLLTETASDFFAAKLGFHVVHLSTIAQPILQSTAFRQRMNTAVAMRLDL